MDLKTRATNILTKPAIEWPIVAVERTTPRELLMGYAAPLAAIPAICGFIGQSIIGISVPFAGTIRVGIVRGICGAFVQFVLALVGAYVAALVIEKLAPKFQSSGDTTQALKLVVYASTPVWLAGVLNILPVLGILTALAGLYAIYLFYLGLPPVMKTPQTQVVTYMVVSALVVIVISVIFGAISASLVGLGTYRM
jgi:hypothetical protein